MYNLRVAEEDDVDAVLEMGRKFYTTTEAAKMIPFDDDSGLAQIFNMLDNGFILLAEKDGELAGMIGCTFFDFPMNRAYQGCTEVMFWIEEEHRGSTLAARLVKESEAIAVHEGASFCVMAALETSPEMIDTFYKHLGYNRSERAFIKGV